MNSSKPPIEIQLSIDSIKDENADIGYGYCSFKYTVKNISNNTINFLTLSISDRVSDDSGYTQETGFELDIHDSTPTYLYESTHSHDFASSNTYCGWTEYSTIPLTRQDTLNHIVAIPPRSSCTFKFKLYGCDPNSVGRVENAPSYNYYLKKEDRSKVKIQLIYDNTGLATDTLYGKKIWVGQLKSVWIDENTR